jgi:hypothetical protein
METPKKYSSDEKLHTLHEPASVYETESKSTANKSEELHPILIKLIEKGKRESQLGMGIPHEEVMRKLKLKFPQLK